MKKQDRQLVAFAGEPNGRITLVDWRWSPGNNHRVVRGQDDKTPITIEVGNIDAPPEDWEDALKVSGCENLTVVAGVVRGGSEDVVDVNHSKNCTVFISEAHPRGNFVLTCKGESKDITIHVDKQFGHGKEVDYDLGNHSDQGDGKTTGVKIHALCHGNIGVRVLRADKPLLSGGPFKWAFPSPNSWYHSWVIRILNLFQ